MARTHTPGDLFAPADEPPAAAAPEAAPEGDALTIAARQFVHRWVLLEHQRAAALGELVDLLADARRRAWAAIEGGHR